MGRPARPGDRTRHLCRVSADQRGVFASRPLRSILIALLVLLGGSVGVDAAVTSATSVESASAARTEISEEQAFVAKINELRSGLGLEPLQVHPTLVPLAREWAVQLRRQGALSHASDLSVGVTENWSRLGENVGVGPEGQVQELFDAFVASPAHYANLVKPDYRYIGVGVVHGDDGRIWTAHRFMAIAGESDSTATTTEPQALQTPLPTTAPTTAPTPAPTTGPTRSSSTIAPSADLSPAGANHADTPVADDAPNAEDSPLEADPRPPALNPALVTRLAADLEAAGI